MRQQLLFLFFCLFISSFAYSQPIDHTVEPLDSILVWMENNYTIDSNNFHIIGLSAIQRSAESNDDKLRADLYRLMADWHGYNGFFSSDSILYYDYKAIDIYKSINDTAAVIDMYGSLSIDLINAGQNSEAQDVIFESIALCEKVDDKAGLAQAHRGLGNLLLQLEKPAESIEYSNLALDYYQSVEDHDLTSYTLLALITAYKDNKEFNKAYAAADECIRIVNDLIPNQVFVLARALSFRSDVYMAEEKYDEALADAVGAWDIVSGQVGEDRAQGWRSTIADILKLQGRYKEALVHYIPSITHLEAKGEDRIYSIYESAATCFEKTGDLKNALKYQRTYEEIKNRINEEKITNLESEAIIKYETGKKDQALAIQQEQIEQKNRVQYLTYGILTLLLGFLGSVLYYYRKNQKITAELRLKNEENQTLVKEIHHRVKNNLQILSSLLSLQSFEEQDEQIIGALQEGRNRVESMGMIHQRLYSRDSLSAINMKEYVPDLCEYLQDLFLSADKEINIKSNIEVGLVDVETAIPLGLIINELITNAVKYAFSNRSEGVINVGLWLSGQDTLTLKVADDGIGFDSDKVDNNSTNFGTKLVDILSKKLKGKVDVSTSDGYATSIVFSRFKLVEDHIA